MRAEPLNIKFFHPTSLLISSRPAPPATLAGECHLQQPPPQVSILVLPSTPAFLQILGLLQDRLWEPSEPTVLVKTAVA